MSAELQPNAELEIAHVLFIDVVGYSRLLINEQSALLAELNQLVRTTHHFCAAEAAGKLIRIPTGDGMALAFFTSPEAPVQCALEICKALQEHPHIHLRMGIHSGPVDPVTDVNDRSNVAGAGMNIAQRIMDCADDGHILLSKRVAEDLAQYGHWKSRLHDLGEIEVKHGAVVSVFNLYGEGFGNSQVPTRIKKQSRRLFPSRRQTPISRRPNAVRAIAFLVLPIAIGISAWVYFRNPSRGVSGAAFIPQKSIAVLPFDNFSDDKQNSYFADGIQDDILTALSQVSDLKVISRNSVMQYRDKARNTREIGQALGVAHLLEGSVRRANDKIRITAQLIDARNDKHLWAEHYDRDLADVFAIQSEVAENIVAQLKANLSASEKAAIDVRPTQDLEAFDIYLQAKQLINTFHDTPDWKETLFKAVRLLDEAISRDGNFALAYCWATRAHLALYWFGLDHTPARLAQARATAQKALVLAPDLGEAHLAQALVYYQGNRDYVHAREELAIARRVLPNNAEVYSVTSWIDRRQGKWEEAVKNQEKAAELDPRNSKILNALAVLYDVLRRYDEEEIVFDRAIAANPSSTAYFQMMRAEIELEKGNIKTARAGLDSLPAGYDPDGAVTSTQINLALYERDPAAAAKILAASKLEELVGGTGSLLPRSWFEALIARAQGDEQKTREAFSAARLKIEAKLHNQPDDGVLLATLGLIDAGLSRKEQALAEGRRAVELRPISDDAVDGAAVIANLAMIYAWVDDVDSAMERLVFLAKTPGGPDYGQLKFDPAWNAVRREARFAKMLDGLRPESGRN
ncbi:MAG TPA: adenylate/guanylate cyclase domain-containing protein [Chthoniobacterales bacterium]|nr:adenylate/guanylate cyclase domain-containing protein [Chthoniobacterales bacterium]